jgi:hypothetical protein
MLKKYPGLEVRDFEVWKNPANARVFRSFADKVGIKQPSVPLTIIGNTVFGGFSGADSAKMEAKIRAEFEAARARAEMVPTLEPALPVKERAASPAPEAPDLPAVSQVPAPVVSTSTEVDLPFLGAVDPEDFSLPLFTLVIAGLDSFNPCALYVLMFLLSLLVYARSRTRMLIVGCTFVFFSGLVYFIFMAAWLNLFFLAGRVAYITTVAGAVALIVGAVNVKDFFAFKEGVSLTMSDEAHTRIFARMRGLLKAENIWSMLLGTVVLAVAANAYELLCTAGFPMVYTRVLTLKELGKAGYYFYLAFYNLVYVVPLAVMVLIFTFTLGSRKLTVWEGRVLKLLSGAMMLMLGSVLVLRPTLLDNALVAAGMLAGAVALTGAMAAIWKRREGSEGP